MVRTTKVPDARGGEPIIAPIGSNRTEGWVSQQNAGPDGVGGTGWEGNMNL